MTGPDRHERGSNQVRLSEERSSEWARGSPNGQVAL
jgi:hypothetical protein